MWPNYPGANVVGAALKFRKRNENLSSCVHVLHKTLNLVISRRCFAEDGKEMYQSVQCTYRASVLLIKTIEARAEGPSVARLINQSGRRPERSESRANSSEKYIYIHIYIFIYIDEGVRPVAWQQCKHSLFDVREREGC